MTEEKPEPPPPPKRRFEVSYLDDNAARRSVGDAVTKFGAQRLAIENRTRVNGGFWQIFDRVNQRILDPFPEPKG